MHPILVQETKWKTHYPNPKPSSVEGEVLCSCGTMVQCPLLKVITLPSMMTMWWRIKPSTLRCLSHSNMYNEPVLWTLGGWDQRIPQSLRYSNIYLIWVKYRSIKEHSHYRISWRIWRLHDKSEYKLKLTKRITKRSKWKRERNLQIGGRWTGSI